jgi:hypothetical protein
MTHRLFFYTVPWRMKHWFLYSLCIELSVLFFLLSSTVVPSCSCSVYLIGIFFLNNSSLLYHVSCTVEYLPINLISYLYWTYIKFSICFAPSPPISILSDIFVNSTACWSYLGQIIGTLWQLIIEDP